MPTEHATKFARSRRLNPIATSSNRGVLLSYDAALAERFLAAKWKLVFGTQLSAAVWVGMVIGVVWTLAT